jgi:hypothetical protein
VEDETRLINRAMALQRLSDRDSNLSSLVVPLQPLHWPAFPHLALPVLRPPRYYPLLYIFLYIFHNIFFYKLASGLFRHWHCLLQAGRLTRLSLAQADSEYHSSAVAAMAIASATAPWRFAPPHPNPTNTAPVGKERGCGELTTHYCLR